MWPSIYGGDPYWGPAKLYDGMERGIGSLTIVSYAAYPYVQLDLGEQRSDITAIRIVARADASLGQSQNLNVYLSADTNFTAGTLCGAAVTFASLGELITVLCPVGVTAQYVYVQMNGTNYLSLQEVTPLYDGTCVRAWCKHMDGN